MNRQLAKQYFERAEAFLNADKPNEALPLLDQLDEAFPNTKNILLARAKTYAALNRTSDALHTCDALIECHQSRRAAALKRELINQAQHLKTSGRRKRVRRFSWPRMVAFSALVVAGTGAFAAFHWPSVEEFEPAPPSDSRHATRDVASRTPPAAPSIPQPGAVHPEHAWEIGEDGAPAWKSGVFRKVPCVNEPARTIDVYLPLAYDAKPEMLFPAVIIQMARGNPGFIGLEDWAERTEVILVGINSSRNSRFVENPIAQDRALETILIGMRLDQRMGFAIGMSGGAQSSWYLVYKYPENFRGLVMMGQGGIPEYMLAPHVRVAYIHGVDEGNNWHIARMQSRLRANGNFVRDELVPGEHVMGPVDRRVTMLNWMVHAARDDFDLPHPGE